MAIASPNSAFVVLYFLMGSLALILQVLDQSLLDMFLILIFSALEIGEF